MKAENVAVERKRLRSWIARADLVDRRPVVWRVQRLVALAAFLVFSVPVFGGTAAAVEENPDIDTAATYEYRVDPSTNTITVTITVKVTADKANQTTSQGTFQYFFDAYGITIPKAAQDLSITDSSGRSLRYSIEYEDDLFQSVLFNFRRNIFFRQTNTTIITFDLIENRNDNLSLVRANDAYIGLDVWTDPLLEAATLEVVTPLGFVNNNPFAVGEGFGMFRAEAGDDGIRFTAGDIDPEIYWAVISLHRPEMLMQETVEVDGHDIQLRYWPGDQAWSDRAEEIIEEGLPLLIDSVGLDWPLDNDLTVTESFDPTLAGYGGWYDKRTAEITVADRIDEHLMMHELSHLWMGEDLFTDRWITEGLANAYAAVVVEQMGEELPEPDQVRLIDDAGIALSSWSRRLTDQETEQWAYPASWIVTNKIVDEVGQETLDAVVQAAYHEEISYLGDSDGEPERNTAATDWRRYLDLLENRSGESDQELQDLFSEWIIDPEERHVLGERAVVRESYFELADRGEGWAPPVGVRVNLSKWLFDAAERRIDSAKEILDRRDNLEEVVSPLQADLPPQLKESYESIQGDGQLETAELFDQADVAAEQLAGSDAGLRSADGVFERVGLIRTDYDIDLASAVDEFEQGDFEAVAKATSSLDRQIDDLGRVGMVRAGVVAAGVLLLGGLITWLVRRRPRSHSRLKVG